MYMENQHVQTIDSLEYYPKDIPIYKEGGDNE